MNFSVKNGISLLFTETEEKRFCKIRRNVGFNRTIEIRREPEARSTVKNRKTSIFTAAKTKRCRKKMKKWFSYGNFRANCRMKSEIVDLYSYVRIMV